MTDSHGNDDHTQVGGGYDRQEPNPKVVVLFAVVLLGFVTISGLGVRGYFLNVVDGEQHVKVAEAPTAELDKMRAAAAAEMHSYGWVDQKTGTMHMPIERAMEMEVQRAAATKNDPAPADKNGKKLDKRAGDSEVAPKAKDAKDTKAK